MESLVEMEHPFANEVLDKIVEYFVDDNFPSVNMDDDDWDMVLQEQFNTTQEHYDRSVYGRNYCDLLEIIHRNAEYMGIDEVEYWDFQKMINLYMHFVATEIIADCKDEIIEKWRDENEDESESEVSQ